MLYLVQPVFPLGKSQNEATLLGLFTVGSCEGVSSKDPYGPTQEHNHIFAAEFLLGSTSSTQLRDWQSQAGRWPGRVLSIVC